MPNYPSTSHPSFKSAESCFATELRSGSRLLCERIEKKKPLKDTEAMLVALASCDKTACGLIACPTCLKRGDDLLIKSFKDLKPGPGAMALLTFTCKQLNPASPAASALQAAHRAFAAELPHDDLCIYDFSGRMFIEPMVISGSRELDYIRIGFAGVFKSEDPLWDGDDVYAMSSVPVGDETNFFESRYYRHFDRNFFTDETRNRMSFQLTHKDYELAADIEASIAMSYGLTKFDDMTIRM